MSVTINDERTRWAAIYQRLFLVGMYYGAGVWSRCDAHMRS